MEGKLVKWREDKQYGIIRSQQDEMIFIQRREFSPEIKHIKEGMRLIFSIKEIGGNKQAIGAKLAPAQFSLHADDVLNAREGVKGEIVRWDNQKGFGFIAVPSCDQEVFFHISTFAYERRRPQIGDHVSFLAVKNGERWQASRVVLEKDGVELLSENIIDAGIFSPQWGKIFLALFIVSSWFLFLIKSALPLAILAVGTSLFSFFLYGWDKYCALKKCWRIPEATLHLWDLFGGWGGGLIARYLFRHKTKKISFIIFFWLTLFLNLGGIVYLIYFQPQILTKINQLF